MFQRQDGDTVAQSWWSRAEDRVFFTPTSHLHGVVRHDQEASELELVPPPQDGWNTFHGQNMTGPRNLTHEHESQKLCNKVVL
jgi:hypothetical protein